MNGQRITLGLIAVGMLLTALLTYLRSGFTDENALLLGVCSKVGIVLLTIFLAWPGLEKTLRKSPTLVNGMLLAALIFLAIRPRLLPLILGGLVVGLFVHFGLRFVTKKLQG